MSATDSDSASETEEPTAPEAIDTALTAIFTWYPVAKKEFKDTVRSKGLWILSAVFTALFVVPAAGVLLDEIQVRRGAEDIGMQAIISVLYLDLVTFLLPLVAIYVGFAAISKERSTGSLKVLLSLPFSRRDVIVGKVLGRMAVVAAAMAFAFLLTAVFFTASSLPFKADLYLLFTLFTFGFALVMVAIAVSISGAVRTTRQSLVANFFVYFYFTFVWNSLANGLGNLLSNRLGMTGAGRWNLVLFVKVLNPSQAYKTLTNSMLGEGGDTVRAARYNMFSQDPDQMATICGDVLNGNATTVQGMFGNQTVCQETAASVPFYFTDAAIFVYMLLWIGVAAVLSYYTFDRVDL